MLTDFEKGIICLVRSGITNEKAVPPEKFDIEKIYSVAKSHQIRSLMLCGATTLEIDRELPVMADLFRGSYHEVVLDQWQAETYQQLKERFEENGILYMPLKGTIMKPLYPQPEMRCMGDIDILIQSSQYENIKEILTELQFAFVTESDHEYIWQKENGVVVELHKKLIPSYNKGFYAYFGEGWERAQKSEGHMHKMTENDEFLYIFTHFAKHYRDGGIGIKHLVDLWIYKKANTLDEDYLRNELVKLNLCEFYENVNNVLKAWFEDGELDEKSELISTVIIKSGAYGLHERSVASSILRKKADKPQAKTGNRLLKIVFQPYKNMCVMYPYLKKLPILLPVAYVIRIVNAIVNKKHKTAMHANDIKVTSSKRLEEYEKQLKFVGLEFNF